MQIVLSAGMLRDHLEKMVSRLARDGRVTHVAAGPAERFDPPRRDGDRLAQARDARRLGVSALAVARYREVLDDGAASGVEELECLLALAELQRESPRAEDWLTRAARLAEGLELSDSQAQVQHLRAQRHLAKGQFEEADALLAEARRLAEETGQTLTVADCLHDAGVLELSRRNASRARVELENAVEKYRELGRDDKLSAALHNLGVSHDEGGDSEGSRRCFEAAIATARAVGSHRREVESLAALGRVLFRSGDRAGGRRCLEEALALREVMGGDPHGRAAVLNNLGHVMAEDGEYESALAYLMEGLRLAQDAAVERLVAVNFENLGIVRGYLEQWEWARSCHSKALILRKELGDRHGEASSLLNLAEINHREGRCDEARRGFARALEQARALGIQPLEAHVLMHQGACRGTDDPTAGLDDLAAALEIADRLKIEEVSVGARLSRAELLRERDPARAREDARRATEVARGARSRRLASDAMRVWESIQ